MKFEIFAGLNGGFGGAQSLGIFDFNDEDEALQAARNAAIEEYESYEGCHGILSREECEEDLIASFGIEYATEDDIDMAYLEEVESWIEYYVEEVE